MSATLKSYICFYNPCNFGDTLFASPFISHICQTNPSRTFYYFIQKGDYIFSGYPEPNLHNITLFINNNDNNKQIQHLIHRNIENKYNDCIIDHTRYIFFNVWCQALSAGDLVFHDLKLGVSRSLDMINAQYNETFINTEIPNNKILPIVHIPKSIYIHNGYRDWIMKWRAGAGAGAGNRGGGGGGGGGGRILVFVFNFTLQSATQHPYIINDYIVGLARMFRNTHTFVVPNNAVAFHAFPNIVCCDKMFEYNESGERSFRNVFILETIVRDCDIIISQYCGASWIWFNQNVIRHYDTHKKPIYITHPQLYNDYATKMNTWIKLAGGGGDGNKNVVQFVPLEKLPSVLL